jgi:hypothetical protein
VEDGEVSCRKVRKTLAGYVDGDLDGKRESEIREHLEGCPGCRLLAEKLETSAAALSSLRPVEISDAASARILDAIQSSRSPRKTPLPGWMRSPGALAAGACAVLILISVVVIGVLVVDPGNDTGGPAPAVTEKKDAVPDESDLAVSPAGEEQPARSDTGEFHGPMPTPVVKATSTDYTEDSLRRMFDELEVKDSYGQRYTMANAISLSSSFVDRAVGQFEQLGHDPALLESMISYITLGEPSLLTCYVERALFHGVDVTIIGFCAPPRRGESTWLTRAEAWVMDPVKFTVDPNTSLIHFLEMK